MKSDQKPMTVEKLLQLHAEDMLKANPEYQRGRVWSQDNKRKLIDSIFRGYPLPLFYLHQVESVVGPFKNTRFEIIDGQQRLNALHDFRQGAFKTFEPMTDTKARFPEFIKRLPCPWAKQDFSSLSAELQNQFLQTQLNVAFITTDNKDESRDLFVRLQAGLPLTPQEKRDAWPGQFTDFVLSLGGKPELSRYPGHDFFTKLMGARSTKDRGKFRQVAAQIAMLFLTRRWDNEVCDIKAASIDDFYYQHIDFDRTEADAQRLESILSKIVELLGDGKRKYLLNHEAIHLVLLVDSLWDDYTRGWEKDLAPAFDRFRHGCAIGRQKKNQEAGHEYWNRYGFLTRSNADLSGYISRRHDFFKSEMLKWMTLTLKDRTRSFGQLDREYVYYHSSKQCAVCGSQVLWNDIDIHHVNPHGQGGPTSTDNAVLVHSYCHPKGVEAEKEFATAWFNRRSQLTLSVASESLPDESATEPAESRSLGFHLNGEFHPARSQADILRCVFSKLAADNPDFPEKFFSIQSHNRKRLILARSPHEIFPNCPRLNETRTFEISPGWWLGLNWNRDTTEKILQLACVAADLVWGRSLIAVFDRSDESEPDEAMVAET